MFIRKTIFLPFLGAFFVFGLLFAPNIASADGISVSPLTFELGANPGEQVANVLRVFNTSDTELLVELEVENFSPVGEEGRVAIEPRDTEVFSLAHWISIEPMVVFIPPHEFVPVEFTISVPSSAEPGGHYASILAKLSGSAPSGSGATIVQKVGSLVLLYVVGEVREELNIASMDIPDFSEYGPVTIATRFQNTGSVHLKPRGFISVRNMFGTEVAKLDLDQKNVLPDSIRKIDTEFNANFLFGKYTATMTAIYGSKNEPLSYSTSFWIIPWKITSGVGFGTLFLLSLLFLARKRIGLAFTILFKGEHKTR